MALMSDLLSCEPTRFSQVALGHNRHFGNLINITALSGRRRALRHAKLLLEALLFDAIRLLIDPRVYSPEARYGRALCRETISAY